MATSMVFRAAFCQWWFVTVFLARHIPVIQAAQVPLRFNHSNWQPASIADNDLSGWSLDELPNPNATGHLVFETVHSLLQQWPNTRLRNGHTIVPGTIPEGTLLYHGTNRNELPPGPEWTSVDPEHSFFFCSDETGRGCWHLTLATTRPLKVVYFDGSSAAKTEWGSLDAQDILIWGVVRPSSMYKEQQRIADLCKWGKGFGLDAFVRMEVDFEVMLCDFTSGVTVVSFSNLASASNPRNSEFFPDNSQDSRVAFESLVTGSWHNRFPGELRVQLDLAGLVSFYDTKLAPSLVPIRAGQERWDHRVQNISSGDVLAARERLAEALTRPEGCSSRIDWRALVRATDSEKILDLARKTQIQLRVMLTPYILRTATPLHGTNLDWAVPIFKLCATTHTSFIQFDSPSMTPSEHLILQAVRETSGEICRVVTSMWASGVHAGLDSMLNPQELPDVREVTNLMDAWSKNVNRLMAWLDWSIWVKCKPACGPEEMCYLPTWPHNFPKPPWEPKPEDPDSGSRTISIFSVREGFRALAIDSTPGGRVDDLGERESVPDELLKPQPKCIRRVEPDGRF
ncbi:hypothetical protein BU15DRAFT_63754 [Melanogaster broomeanus]|nr:hypothetical protein BU15DRAFT_63754 [Melanogaster broomeanus]